MGLLTLETQWKRMARVGIPVSDNMSKANLQTITGVHDILHTHFL
jgi:hypothetical protein